MPMVGPCCAGNEALIVARVYKGYPMLNFVRNGPETGLPLIVAHGLFGSVRNWGVLSKRLAETRPVITVDMRNHGESPWLEAHSYKDLAEDLAEVIDYVGGRADVLGHSMGGKAAMVLALHRPELVARLVVADIAPVGYTHTQSHLIAAMNSVDLSKVKTRRDADAQLAQAIPEAGVRAFLLQSLDLTGSRPRWRLNLEILARDMAEILDFPPLSARFDDPTLFLTGANSDYVTPQHHDEIARLFPAAKFQQIADAGHWLHAENPRDFEAAVQAFLKD